MSARWAIEALILLFFATMIVYVVLHVAVVTRRKSQRDPHFFRTQRNDEDLKGPR